MRRRSDAIDRLLEDWASWRQSGEHTGTGDCVIVRFREPAGSWRAGSQPLWFGFIASQLAALDSHLTLELGPKPVAVLVILYGVTGTLETKARQLQTPVKLLNECRRQARVIALKHLPEHLTVRGLHHANGDHCSRKIADGRQSQTVH
ncbi:MAG: hypothetical protein ABW146_20100 [Candidatus Sedimenticola sp. 6PFRAG7]